MFSRGILPSPMPSRFRFRMEWFFSGTKEDMPISSPYQGRYPNFTNKPSWGAAGSSFLITISITVPTITLVFDLVRAVVITWAISCCSTKFGSVKEKWKDERSCVRGNGSYPVRCQVEIRHNRSDCVLLVIPFSHLTASGTDAKGIGCPERQKCLICLIKEC